MEHPTLQRHNSAAQEILTRYLQGLHDAGDPARHHPAGGVQYHTGSVANGSSGGRNQRLLLMGDRRYVLLGFGSQCTKTDRLCQERKVLNSGCCVSQDPTIGDAFHRINNADHARRNAVRYQQTTDAMKRSRRP